MQLGDPDGQSSLKSIELQFVKSHGVVWSESTPRISSRWTCLQNVRSATCNNWQLTHWRRTTLARWLEASWAAWAKVVLLIDWMELLDLEMISPAQLDVEVISVAIFASWALMGPRFHLSFLSFSFRIKTSLLLTPNSPICRPYALAMHQTSWATLRKCIHKLLSARMSTLLKFERRGESGVLDILTALIKVPSCGREKHLPNHQHPEELLNFTIRKYFSFCNFFPFRHRLTDFSYCSASCSDWSSTCS